MEEKKYAILDSAEKPPVLETGLRSRMAYGNSHGAVS